MLLGIAADVRYPDFIVVLVEFVSCVCFYFYGTGSGFTTACRTEPNSFAQIGIFLKNDL